MQMKTIPHINIKESIKEALREGQEIVESDIRNTINVYL